MPIRRFAATSGLRALSRNTTAAALDNQTRYMRATATGADAPPPPRRKMRRGLLAICLLAAGAAAFRRRRFQPNWSFRRSADWVIARTPTRYGDALRTIRKCMDCDALEVSLRVAASEKLPPLPLWRTPVDATQEKP